MNAKRKVSFLVPGLHWAVVPCWVFLLVVLLLECTACAGLNPAAIPAPQVFNSPTTQISSFATLTILSKDDPTQAHWVDFFGAAVAIDGDILVSGAPRWGRPPGEGDGAAYVYRRSSDGKWQAEATLIASDRDDGFQYDQHFGQVVAVKGNLIAIGVPGYDDPQIGDNTGAVYLYEYKDGAWVETGKLIPFHRKVGDKYGSALAFDGDLLAVSGSPTAASIATFQRSAGGWRELTPLPVPSPADGKVYYVLIDLYGDTLALSTVAQQPPPKDEHNEQALIQSLRTAGVVTLYERVGDKWKQTFQTLPQEATLYKMDDYAPFGLPVSLGGQAGKADLLAIGKPGFPTSGRELGSVATYTHEDRGWQPQAELSLAPGEQVPGAMKIFSSEVGSAFFGVYVDIEGSRLAVVSTFANAVYVFERQDSGWVYRYRVTPGPDFGDDFQRRTVGLSGSELLLGSPGELGGGYAFIFTLPQ